MRTQHAARILSVLRQSVHHGTRRNRLGTHRVATPMGATQNVHLPQHKHGNSQRHVLECFRDKRVTGKGHQHRKHQANHRTLNRRRNQGTTVTGLYRVLHLADTIIDQVQRRDRVILFAEHVKSGERIIVTNEGGDCFTGGQGLALSLRQARRQVRRRRGRGNIRQVRSHGSYSTARPNPGPGG